MILYVQVKNKFSEVVKSWKCNVKVIINTYYIELFVKTYYKNIKYLHKITCLLLTEYEKNKFEILFLC